MLKGLLVVFSSDPPCKDGNVRFTTVPYSTLTVHKDTNLLVHILEYYSNYLYSRVYASVQCELI